MSDVRNPTTSTPSGPAGGELGGSYPNPTVNATHSGSAHHAQDHDDTHHTQSPILKSLVTAVGDMIYATASATIVRLAGNITTTKKFLSQTGDGVNSAAPVWNALAAADYPHVHRVSDVGSTLGVLGERLFFAGAVEIDESGITPFRVKGTSTTTALVVDNSGTITAQGSMTLGRTTDGNLIAVQPTLSGNPVKITASGIDSSIDLWLVPKALGRAFVRGSLGGLSVENDIVAGYTKANSLTVAGSATTVAVALTATGTDNDISVNAVPKGAGHLQENGTNVSLVTHTTPAMTATVAGHVPTPPNNTTTFLRGDGTFATPAIVTWTRFTTDLGTSKTSGSFDITGLSGLTADKFVAVQQTAAQISSKGNARDESEMDRIVVDGYVVDAATIRCYWNASAIVVGTYDFAYMVSG